MRRALIAAALAVAACAAPAAEAPAPVPVPPVAAPIAEAPPAPAPLGLDCAGLFEQGGVGLCRTAPGAEFLIDGTAFGAADAEGLVVFGFDRDAPAVATLAVRTPDGRRYEQAFAVATRTYDVQRVDGLPPQTVTPTEPAVLEKIKADGVVKAKARESRAPVQGFLDGFAWPLQGRISSPWGNQRILNGEPRPPHYGVDIAAPTGTPVTAAASGVVALAEPDLHYEGGMVMIDHGQGLFSYYLHMSRLDVVAGQAVAQGAPIGAVGAKGRATGPHLCWRMRWRDRALDPSRAIDGLAAAKAALAAP